MGPDCYTIKVESLIPNYKSISIASVNALNQIVISGAGDQIAELIPIFQSRGIRAVKLNVSHAFHSPLMNPIVGSFKEKIHTIDFQRPVLPILSNVTGSWAGAEMADSEYWANHILAPVKFYNSLQMLQREGFDIFLEIGPQPVLTNLARQSLGDHSQLVFLASITASPKIEKLCSNRLELYIQPGHIFPVNTFIQSIHS